MASALDPYVWNIDYYASYIMHQRLLDELGICKYQLVCRTNNLVPYFAPSFMSASHLDVIAGYKVLYQQHSSVTVDSL